MKKKKHLTIDEKRDWLANIFRDESGEYSKADKFKAMAEDTRLAQLLEEQKEAAHKSAPEQLDFPLLSAHLPPPEE